MAVALDLISFEAHRFLASDLPVASVLLGGALFGAGMVLTGGCVSRLTVLVGTGNLRALLVLVVFAVTAHAVMKGALAPIREALGNATLPGGAATELAAWPGGEIWPAIVAGAAFLFALLSRARISHLAMAAAIGLLVPLGWIGTGFVLLDDFDPIPAASMGFTGPMADTLFWAVAATSIPAGFGTGLAAGVILGSLAAALAAGEFRWQSLEGPRQTGRYLAGAVMMGVGGVAGGRLHRGRRAFRRLDREPCRPARARRHGGLGAGHRRAPHRRDRARPSLTGARQAATAARRLCGAPAQAPAEGRLP